MRQAKKTTFISATGCYSRRSSTPGAITGTVLRAARLSAGLTMSQLAEVTGNSRAALWLWEHGNAPLGDEPTASLARLRGTLHGAGADPQIIGDLDDAAWCDLIVTGLIEGIRTHLDEPPQPSVLELLAWAAAGTAPDRYVPYIAPGPLLPPSDVEAIADAACYLARETCPGARQYGMAVTAALRNHAPGTTVRVRDLLG